MLRDHLSAGHMIVAGPSNSGKTMFTKNLLKLWNVLCEDKTHTIYYFYGEELPKVFEELKTFFSDEITFVKGIPADFMDVLKESGRKDHTLAVFDDLMGEVVRRDDCELLFTNGRHHGISTIYLTQNLYQKNQRSRSLQCAYYVIMKNPRCKNTVKYLSGEMFPECPTFLQQAYEMATRSQPWSYIFVDMRQDVDDGSRVLSKIFERHPSVYVPCSSSSRV